MPNSTTNYNLKKPLSNENYNIQDSNDNMDIIDTALKDLDDKIDDLAGEGNTKTVKQLENELTSHKADIVTDVDGAHGLKIEEGEWTPDMNSNPTITVQQGYYYKIGKKVTVWGKLEYSAKGTDPGIQLYIKGLPFATGNPVYTGQIPNFRGTSIIIDSASRITGFVNYNVIYLGEVLSTGAASALNFGEINNSGSINFTVTYLTN